MVKGVSKTVIVVNNTGSKLFEKIVFYVTPEYGTLSAKQLKKAASSFSFNYDDTYSDRAALIRRWKRKRQLKLFLLIGLAFIIAASAILLIIM